MNERMTRKILSEARSSLEPTQADRERMHKKVMAAVGAAGVVTAAAATAADAVGGFSSGIPHFVTVIFKFVIGCLIVGGMTGLALVLTSENGGNEKRAPSAVVEKLSTPKSKITAAAPPLPNIEQPAPDAIASDAEPVHVENVSQQETGIGIVPKRTANTQSRKPVAPPNDDALLREISLIKSASSSLSRGNFERTFDILREYDKTYPSGVMRQERDGLYISALCGAGRRGEAEVAARKFHRRYPNSPLAVRIDESCGELIDENNL